MGGPAIALEGLDLDERMHDGSATSDELLQNHIAQVRPAEVRDLLQVRLERPGEYHARPAARHLARHPDKRAAILELLPVEFVQPCEPIEVTYEELADEVLRPRGRSMTRTERDIIRRCERIAKRMERAEPDHDNAPVNYIAHTVCTLTLEARLNGQEDGVPLREVLRTLKQWLRNPSACFMRRDRLLPVAALYGDPAELARA